MQTYDDLGTINHLDHCPLPSYEEVVAAVHDLTELIYPATDVAKGCIGATSTTMWAIW